MFLDIRYAADHRLLEILLDEGADVRARPGLAAAGKLIAITCRPRSGRRTTERDALFAVSFGSIFIQSNMNHRSPSGIEERAKQVVIQSPICGKKTSLNTVASPPIPVPKPTRLDEFLRIGA